MDRITVELAKAEPLVSPSEAPDFRIEIRGICPGKGGVANIKEFYRQQAGLLGVTLRNCLPQGTLHALLIDLLLHAPVLYRGSYPKRKEDV